MNFPCVIFYNNQRVRETEETDDEKREREGKKYLSITAYDDDVMWMMIIDSTHISATINPCQDERICRRMTCLNILEISKLARSDQVH